MDFTVIDYYDRQINSCGYCKEVAGTGSRLHGMNAICMSVQDYQDLIDRGWRRSGKYCYKPNNRITCCPCYTIRCDALEFKLLKSHKKILKRMNRFLRDGQKDKDDEMEVTEGSSGGNYAGGGDINDEPKPPTNIPIHDIDLGQIKTASLQKNLKSKLSNVKVVNDVNNTEKSKLCENNVSVNTNTQTDKAVNANADKQNSTDNQKPPCKKAKQMRLERKKAKLAAKGIDINLQSTNLASKCNKEKSLSDFIKDTSDTDKHKLKIVLLKTNKECLTQEVYNLYYKYQTKVHNDSPKRLTPTQFKRFLLDTPLQLKLVDVKSKDFVNSLNSEYAVYEKYQTKIHGDPPVNINEFRKFLGFSPLQKMETSNGPACGYGSFHQQYWLDDKLIAVGVIDILPHSVSAVYFFYDPDYRFLSLGTYGSLRELELVQQLAQTTPELKYYYMGFYIHENPKMRYKGKLIPSYLLCPETYNWNLLNDEVRKKLDEHKYQRLNSDLSAKDSEEFLDEHLGAVKLLLGDNNTCITYQQYIQITGDDGERCLIIQYGKLVGKTCAHRMLYIKS